MNNSDEGCLSTPNLSEGITLFVWFTALIALKREIGATRYSTAARRALYRAIEELERFQAARKARGESAASTDAQLAQPPADMNEGQPEKQGSRAFEDPENGVGKVEAAQWRGYTTPAERPAKVILQNEPTEP